MSKKLLVSDLAQQINTYIENYEYYFAYGLVKETVALWKNNPDSFKLLNESGQLMVKQVCEP